MKLFAYLLLANVVVVSVFWLNCSAEEGQCESSCHKSRSKPESAIHEASEHKDEGRVKVSEDDGVVVTDEKEAPKKPKNFMAHVLEGQYSIGLDKPIMAHDGEAPKRMVHLDSYYIDKYEVSNADFEMFVTSTNYVTEAEKFGDSFALENMLSPEVNAKIDKSVEQAPWWLLVPGTDWRHPSGPDSSIEGHMNDPVTHVTWHDAEAYCKWVDKRLPTEAEFEVACKGGKSDRMFPWGNSEQQPKGTNRMNKWEGQFPQQDTPTDGYPYLAPVDALGPQNSLGLHNIIGNVWEWTQDWNTIRHDRSGKTVHNPAGPEKGTDKVKKGGSFMCTKEFCYRYRCAARHWNTPDTSSINIGFRCASNTPPS